jgi:cell division protein ZapA
MEKRQLKIDLLGTSFVIQSDESTEHLNRLSAHVKSRIEEVRKRYPFAEPLTVAVLAALNIADEMIKVREGREPTEASELDSVAEKLISRIDDDLLDHTPLSMDGEEARGREGPKAGAPEPDEETPQS